MSLTYSGKEASQGPCHQNNSLTLHSGFADRKARHEGDEITQPQACRGPASEAASPESNLKPSPHCFWVNQTHHHSHICVLGFMGSPALLASQVKGSTSLASKFPGIFFFFSSSRPIQQLIFPLRLSTKVSTVRLVSVMWNHAHQDLDQDYAAHFT